MLTSFLLGLAASVQLAVADYSVAVIPRAAADTCSLRPDNGGQVVCRRCASLDCEQVATISSADAWELECYCPRGQVVNNSPYVLLCIARLTMNVFRELTTPLGSGCGRRSCRATSDTATQTAARVCVS